MSGCDYSVAAPEAGGASADGYRSMGGERSLPGTLVIDETDAELLHRAVPEILKALVTLPRRRYGGDYRRYAQDLGLEGARLEFLVDVADMEAERY
ncbi:hypothetical protein [Rathayibacter toxicus]|uniref:hypothetical protein n=1 Tax=Rathayibacter toxicus TaxID=145458 RepID=UPI001C05E48E|nr:hypothetical protein [Rathayibacter toxicus]QWL29565.1 hypothetical protein E2R34_01475 [Rathayibacter toxicus]QWL31648.1 hypothetical protein E2R35_01460 [Rathayibacter toxicus]QWL33740.1 hypothetical protein E2R36_01460 [Rathayibacter toxicus]QWL35874.1 hypothetical protein E2R37_01460 [Rathayibacter toxicus]QWL37964.1 hypothetical protein E2R38_01460 [Rathayibacter toxicus]